MGRLFGPAGTNGRNGKTAEAPPTGPVVPELKHVRSALFHAYHEQVSRLCSMPGASNFASKHLKEKTLAEHVVQSAEQLMTETLRSGQPRSQVSREHEMLMLMIDTLPGSSKSAADHFTERHGSYVAFQSKIVEAPEFKSDGYKVFVHVIFGEEKKLKNGLFMPWATIGVMPVWEASLTEWVAPRVCCNDQDRQLLGF
jgi:hypothetical protein